MAAVVGALIGFDWKSWGSTAWTWANAQSGSGIAYLAGLPQDCKRASTHAALVCLGQLPEYFNIPGFPPIVLA